MKASELIAVARSYIGVKENPPNSNKCIFTQMYGMVTAWCVIFIWCLFYKLGASSLFYGGKKCCSCSVLMGWAKSNKQWVTKGYKPGDLILYDWNGDGRPEHIGICVAVNGNTLTAIEGNTSIGNDSDGGQVLERTRKLSQVLGAVRPKYEAESGTSTTTSGGKVMIELAELRKGSTGAQVKALQRMLYAQGYKGADGKALLSIDGDFGSNTQAALTAWQKVQGLSADGICGTKSWNRMLKGV